MLFPVSQVLRSRDYIDASVSRIMPVGLAVSVGDRISEFAGPVGKVHKFIVKTISGEIQSRLHFFAQFILDAAERQTRIN